MSGTGGLVFGGGLNPSPPTVVRSADDKIVITAGPFAETKEQLGGFWIIDADDLDAARGWAAKLTVACRRPIEVRTFEDDDAAVQELFEHTLDHQRSIETDALNRTRAALRSPKACPNRSCTSTDLTFGRERSRS